MLRSLAPKRRRLMLSVAALSTGALIAALVALIPHHRPTKPTSQAVAGPVLLVPGFGGSTTGLEALSRTLRSHGKDVVVVRLPGDGRGDLDEQAAALASEVTQTLERTGADSVDIVGYSAGGVVARLWVRWHGGASQARRVITLGSPQHGSDIATLAGSILPGACPTACQQLATDSDLLAMLNNGDETPRGLTFVSIWTTHDDVVIPPESASLAGALNVAVQSVCATDQVRHGGLPTDHVVQSMVLAELAAGPPLRLGPADCARFSS